MSAAKVSRTWRRLFFAHAALVVGLTTLFFALSAMTAPEDGVNIGAAFLAMPLLPLGLPWSLPALTNPYQFDGLSPILWSLVTFGPAMLNVLLHGAVMLAVGHLRRR